MTAQYWVGEFCVDLTRNQISYGGQSQTLAPKALAVLTCLAQHQGKVVSQDALLSSVWQGVVVSPNTLQRSIAQLRRALGDDGKGQQLIKTHAKQGYSLECEVKWCADAAEESGVSPTISTTPDPATHSTPTESKAAQSTGFAFLPQLVVGGVLLVVLAVVGYFYREEGPQPIVVESIRLLTATDDKEFDPSYSPDGEHIVFHRYRDKLCDNRLWALDTNSRKETLLTPDWAAYGPHSFSEDGSKLAFLATEACNQPVTQRNCYDLVSLDFNAALQSPQQPEVVLSCKYTDVRKPQWLNNRDIALLQKQTDRWVLMKYSTHTNTSTTLYSLAGGNILDYLYSPVKKRFAVIGMRSDGSYHIDMLTPDGRRLSSHPIQRPEGMSQYGGIYPSFDPVNDRLIFSTGRQLFTLSYEGKIFKINTVLTDRMYLPAFHPRGTSMLMIKGPYDTDVVLRSFSNLGDSGDAAVGRQYVTFERSNVGDSQGAFQPGGDLIAFRSARSGEEQVWVSDGQGPRQLTDFGLDTYIRGIKWAADGQSLLVNANNILVQVGLDSSAQTFDVQHPVLQLLHWDSVSSKILVFARIAGVKKLVEYDFSSGAWRVVSDKNILWAQKDADGRIIIKDELGQFWQPGPVEYQPIEVLSGRGTGTGSETFVVRDYLLFAINSHDELWSYNLKNDEYTVLGPLEPGWEDLTDVNQETILLSMRVSAKKEVVEVILGE
ncbi:winged helix-turn-helix domain-containing protein [Gilvimarinus sp. SDUM040013]|uniref:Winged helix-turn-helix domain-containing protein n=1 Tax=Gilvimarinus gilvus TaxID=3058038 RepID=A0ABU4RYY0_9GAMM|nr:winged helix-turn-helix domain-containing protein [Gilvimarinus sp. SDUM040013]MDO3384545.1 winged helix-turn-helix domain-containing protein [Gilvimarinus sp. SDUM040013]MDX6850120.1 winged helix-turn-helix domain-containing protein [Gilvimarinus sp. SDUM040013]